MPVATPGPAGSFPSATAPEPAFPSGAAPGVTSPPMAARPTGVDEAPSSFGVPDSPDVLPTVDSPGALLDLSATTGDGPPLHVATDPPGASPTEPVDPGAALTSTGGGGDGVVLFDQDGEPIEASGDDGGARMAGRYFRQR